MHTHFHVLMCFCNDWLKFSIAFKISNCVHNNWIRVTVNHLKYIFDLFNFEFYLSSFNNIFLNCCFWQFLYKSMHRKIELKWHQKQWTCNLCQFSVISNFLKYKWTDRLILYRTWHTVRLPKDLSIGMLYLSPVHWFMNIIMIIKLFMLYYIYLNIWTVIVQ
jgi:hypothetical protein